MWQRQHLQSRLNEDAGAKAATSHLFWSGLVFSRDQESEKSVVLLFSIRANNAILFNAARKLKTSLRHSRECRCSAVTNLCRCNGW